MAIDHEIKVWRKDLRFRCDNAEVTFDAEIIDSLELGVKGFEVEYTNEEDSIDKMHLRSVLIKEGTYPYNLFTNEIYIPYRNARGRDFLMIVNLLPYA